MKKFSSKQALLLSVLSMVLCVSMLIGSTFAWFTDSATANVKAFQRFITLCSYMAFYRCKKSRIVL